MSRFSLYSSVGESEPSRVSSEGVDDDQALLERLAKREERRQRRMKEALERQKELDPTIGTANGTDSRLEEQSSISSSTRRKDDEEAKEEKAAPKEVTHTDSNSWRKEEDDKKEDVFVCLYFYVEGHTFTGLRFRYCFFFLLHSSGIC